MAHRGGNVSSHQSRRPRASTILEQIDLSSMYKLRETVGTGGFGKVKLATHTLTGETVAIKIMDKKALGVSLIIGRPANNAYKIVISSGAHFQLITLETCATSDNNLDEIFRCQQEIEILKAVRHPRIAELYQVIDAPDKLYLVLEHCANGELFDYLMTKERLEESEARRFFRQILSAVAYLHDKGCSHRDLKPENLLLDEKQNIKVIDFGLAARPKTGMDTLLETCCGSPAYVAPELINGDKYLGAAADIWSLGILLYALLVGALPFSDDDVNKLFKKIQRGSFKTPDYVSADAKSLLRDMLQVDPAKRITMSQLISNRWVMNPYCQPVKWNFPEQTHIDTDILQAMSPAGPLRVDEMRESVVKRKFDYWHCTYLILKSKARQGRAVKLDIAGIPLHNQSNHNEGFRVPMSSPCGSPTKRGPATAVRISTPRFESPARFDISFDKSDDEANSDTSMSEAGSIGFSRESLTFFPAQPEPVLPPLPPPMREMYPLQTILSSGTKKKNESPSSKKEGSPRITPSKSLDREVKREKLSEDLSLATRRNVREKSKSVEDGLENRYTMASPKNAKAMKRVEDKPRKLGSARKVFGSIEKGLDRMKEMLTPIRDSVSKKRPIRVLKANDMTNNVMFVNCADAMLVLEGIKAALSACEYQWKLKRGYTIRAKRFAPNGQLLLKLSLEVCWIVDRQACGIMRKRLEGDAFQYKKLYAELYSKILNFANSDMHGTKPVPSDVQPQRLAFDC